MNHYVYLTTNLINNKKYIGKHSTSKNIEDDDYLGSGVLISKAIQKYGKENFKRDILHICDSEEEAFILEMKEIEEQDAVKNPMYYNLSVGGKGNYTGSLIKPPDFKKHPIIFNPKKYISDINKNFKVAKGSTFYKLKYYCIYLFVNDYSFSNAIDILLDLSKNIDDIYPIKSEYWIKTIKNIVDEVYNYSETDIEKNFGKTNILIYKLELDRICCLSNNLSVCDGKRIKKIAFGLLMYYKITAKEIEEYIEFNNSAICMLGGITLSKDDREKFYNLLLEIGYICIKDNKYLIKCCINDEYDCVYAKISSYSIDENINLLLAKFEGNNKVTNCKKCGAFIMNNKTGTKKYCSYCSKYDLKCYKAIKCIDCGKEIIIAGRNNRQTRCHDCYTQYRRENNRKNLQKYRMNKKIS